MLTLDVSPGVPEAIRRAILETVDSVNIDGPRLTAKQRLNGVADRLSGLVVRTNRKVELLVVQAAQQVAVHLRASLEPLAIIQDDGLTFDELVALGAADRRAA